MERFLHIASLIFSYMKHVYLSESIEVLTFLFFFVNEDFDLECLYSLRLLSVKN